MRKLRDNISVNSPGWLKDFDMIVMPPVKQVPTPNYSPQNIRHDLIILHLMEGGYAGSVAWLCNRSVKASAHLCMKADGSEVTQLVPLGLKAWAQCAFNDAGPSVEIEGFTQHGLSDQTLNAAAQIAAWLCVEYDINPVWAQQGKGRGVCCHHDLGAAGGGHVDICQVGAELWQRMMRAIVQFHAQMKTSPAPPFALHGVPNPSQAVLPPSDPPSPSHGGAPRIQPGEMPVPHNTDTGFPLASIHDWQTRLVQVGANPTLTVDNIEGGATRAAIGVFQKACNLPITNDVNPATWARLYAMTAK
jgi:hypothetical protein